MRIVVAGPPKTGNVWIENILALLYGLEILLPPRVPANTAKAFQQFVADGLFPDDAIFHQHFSPAEEFFQMAAAVPCHLVTVVRDPYDTFVSLYYYIQNFKDDFIRAGDVGTMAISKPLDHPDVLDFLEHGFRWNLETARDWCRSRRSILIRYEDLHRDPAGQVKQLADRIRPVEDPAIRRALAGSEASVLRAKRKGLAKHIRRGQVGDWKNHLTDAHLEIFRRCHADVIREMDYPVVEGAGIGGMPRRELGGQSGRSGILPGDAGDLVERGR